MERKSGFYWVRTSDYKNCAWEVAEWCSVDGGGYWNVFEIAYECNDDDMKEINENRIMSPDECVDMQNTENKFKHDGLWYIAVEQDTTNFDETTNWCEGCYFQDKQCASVPDCYPEKRQDNRNVIFVRSDADNLGDEE